MTHLPREIIPIIYSYIDNYFLIIRASNTCSEWRIALQSGILPEMQYFIEHATHDVSDLPIRSRELFFSFGLLAGLDIEITYDNVDFFLDFYTSYPPSLFIGDNITQNLRKYSGIDYNISRSIQSCINTLLSEHVPYNTKLPLIYLLFAADMPEKLRDHMVSMYDFPNKCEEILCRHPSHLIIDNRFVAKFGRDEAFAKRCLQKCPGRLRNLTVTFPRLVSECLELIVANGIKISDYILLTIVDTKDERIRNLIEESNDAAVIEKYLDLHPEKVYVFSSRIVLPLFCKYLHIGFYEFNIKYINDLFKYHAWGRIRELIEELQKNNWKSSQDRLSQKELFRDAITYLKSRIFKSKRIDLIKMIVDHGPLSPSSAMSLSTSNISRPQHLDL